MENIPNLDAMFISLLSDRNTQTNSGSRSALFAWTFKFNIPTQMYMYLLKSVPVQIWKS